MIFLSKNFIIEINIINFCSNFLLDPVTLKNQTPLTHYFIFYPVGVKNEKIDF